MQSKAAFVLLGFLKERPMNPYEIIKILEKLKISQWSHISPSSVYATIHVLEKKGYIVGEKFKTTAMPEKTVYSVTSIGKKAFIKALKDYITNDITDITRFNLGTLFICHLDKENVLKILHDRISNITKNIEITEKVYEDFKTHSAPEYSIVSLVHNINFYRAELVSVHYMIDQIEVTTAWGHFLTADLD
jgi:DNA-binding PadR family transcriptional regulator